MEVVKLIQPHEFGDNFIFEDGKWKVKFPPIATSGVEVSKDANNLVTLGTDGGMFVDATRIHAYALVQDNENMKIHLYRYLANIEFDVAVATLINSIDMLELNGQFDGITITDAVVTFKDVQTDSELVFDTNQFQNVEELSFEWPLSAKNDDKLKVGATDRIEVTINLATNKLEMDWVRFSIYDIDKELDLFDYKYAGNNQDIADGLNANIDPDKNIMFELVSLVEVGQLTEVKVAIINTSNEDRQLECSFNPYTNGLFGLEYETVLADVTGTPSYEWYFRQGSNAALRCYLAAKDTVIEDNGISPTASIIEVYVPKYYDKYLSENALVNTPEGLLVLPPEGVQIDHSLELRSFNVDVPNEEQSTVHEFVRNINGHQLHIPATVLKNMRGKTLGAIVSKLNDKLPVPTTDRTTIHTNKSILDSRVKINGLDNGSFANLIQNEISQLEFILINDNGGDGYGSYDSSYNYDDGYGSYDNGYEVVSGYSFMLRNKTSKRLRVTIEGFNTSDIAVIADGVNNKSITANGVSFDLIGRFTDHVSLYLAFCDENGTSLTMSQRDELHEGGTTLRLEATYLDSGSFSPPIEVTVDGESHTLTAVEGSRTAFYTITLPVIDDHLNQYYWPEIEIRALAGTPIDYNINPYPVAVRSLIPMPDIVVSSSGVITPYGCEEFALKGGFNYVYRPKVGSEKAIVSSGGTFGFTIAPRFANMNVFYDADDVLPEEQLIGKLDSSGGINFTIKELIPREDDDAAIGIRDVDIHANYYINIAVRRM